MTAFPRRSVGTMSAESISDMRGAWGKYGLGTGVICVVLGIYRSRAPKPIVPKLQNIVPTHTNLSFPRSGVGMQPQTLQRLPPVSTQHSRTPKTYPLSPINKLPHHSLYLLNKINTI